MLSSRSAASLSSTILLFDFPRTVANEIGIIAIEISVVLSPFRRALQCLNVWDSPINRNFICLVPLLTPGLSYVILHPHLMVQCQFHSWILNFSSVYSCLHLSYWRWCFGFAVSSPARTRTAISFFIVISNYSKRRSLNTFGCRLNIAFSNCLGPMLVMIQLQLASLSPIINNADRLI